MADGGRFPWKVQKFVSRGPTGDYSGLREPLPNPPDGMKWMQDTNTREWKLVNPNNVIANVNDCNRVEVEGDENNLVTVSCPQEEDWELLSDKKNGSVRSLCSFDESHSNNSHNNSSNIVSSSLKLRRTHSSSTIDSNDNVIGPSGWGVLGVDYVEHVILPTDTLQGICLSYKINSQRLKQANHFSGNSLVLAPKKLVIPISKKAIRSGFIRVQDTDAKEYKIHSMLAEFRDLSTTEAKAYLEMADWDLEESKRSAREDTEWEKEVDSDALHSGQIRIRVNKSGTFQTSGAGLSPKKTKMPSTVDSSQVVASKNGKEATIIITNKEAIPRIATKTVKAHDVYKAAQQHGSYGVELKAIQQPLLNDSRIV